MNPDVRYKVKIVRLLNGYPILDSTCYPQNITFLTARDSATCGVYLELDEDYLDHMYVDDFQHVYRSGCAMCTRAGASSGGGHGAWVDVRRVDGPHELLLLKAANTVDG